MDGSPSAELDRSVLSAGSIWRRGVVGRLARIEDGLLVVNDDEGKATFGRPAADGLKASMTVHDPGFWRRLALGGSLGASESFAEGEWTTDDLTSLVRLFARNRKALVGIESGLAALRRPLEWVKHALRRNTRGGSRQNIQDHYDMGNDFFALMLDPTMTYSCAVFDPPESTLEQASVKKLDMLCRKLDLRPSDHLLEIGTGWGSLALHAAGRFGCRVTTTTISNRQYELARERVRGAGLQNRVTLLLCDYRDLDGRYDKLVSIEMIEAVGAEYYETFFGKCASLLTEEGLFALQAITIADQHYEDARRDVDFIKRYIFPGSNIPSTTALLTAATRASDLRLRHLEDLTPHYARTLAAWRENLESNRQAVERITEPRFRRLWHFYLCYCEAGFRERHIGDVQMLLARPRR